MRSMTTQCGHIERMLFPKVKGNLELFGGSLRCAEAARHAVAGPVPGVPHSSDQGMSSVCLFGITWLEGSANTFRDCSLRERARRDVLSMKQRWEPDSQIFA
jgi:hypothetical protein